MDSSRLLLIGLDAADPVLLEGWMETGALPHLAALRRAGAYGRLSSPARHLAGSPWPSFYTGQPASSHGIYHDFQWRPERMGYGTPTRDWLPATPFWRRLEGGVRVVAHDVPMVQGCEPFEGVELSGWASHDKLAEASSWPAEILGEAARRFGSSGIPAESFGPAKAESLLELQRRLLESIPRSRHVGEWLLGRPWDLAIVVLGALHPGGHRLFDRSGILGDLPEALASRFDGALRELYEACDEAVGRLVSSAEGAAVIVFSLHGMMANSTRADLLDEMLARVLRGDSAASARRGKLRRLVEALPLSWRRLATRAVPELLKDRLMTLWATGGIDWGTTRAFTLRADLQGYVRVNLKGREAQGIVAPGDAHDALCREIAEGLLSFRDASTGEPFVRAVHRSDRLFPEGGRRDLLPDLVVEWEESPGRLHQAVESPRFGRVSRSTPGRIPNGRSGNHRPEGFILARAEGVRGGSGVAAADVLDLAPTALHILGARTSLPLAGSVIPELRGAR